MEKSRLKRKVWITSFSLTVMCIMIIIHAPNIYLQILPIIIPSSMLTMILPIYTIDKKKKDNSKKGEINILEEKQQSENSINQSKIISPKIVVKENNDLIDDIMTDQNLKAEDKKQMLTILKKEYEQSHKQELQTEKCKKQKKN